MMDEIPCRVCGDKSSGINFGVISCQDCYVFFRNAHESPCKNLRGQVYYDLWESYNCSEDETCVVDRDNKDRCNECRYLKCGTVGMKFVNKAPYGWGYISGTLKDFTATVTFLHTETVRRLELIKMKLSEPQDDLWLNMFRSITYEEKWTKCSILLSNSIDSIIFFVKNLPQIGSGFDTVSNQILHSKYCLFEVVVVRISRLINLESDLVLYGSRMIPISECVNACEPLDMEVMSSVFDAAKAIARLKLTETELAIFQALVLSWPDRNIGKCRVNDLMTVLHYKSVAALREEIQKRNTTLEGDDSFLRTIMDTLYPLKSASKKHIEALRRFEEAYPAHSYQDAEVYRDLYGTRVPNPRFIRTDFSNIIDNRKEDTRTH